MFKYPNISFYFSFLAFAELAVLLYWFEKQMLSDYSVTTVAMFEITAS